MAPPLSDSPPSAPAAPPPARRVVTYGGRSLTAVALARAAAQLAARLAALGVGPGDRVVTRLANAAAPVVAVDACRRLGAVLVPLNPRAPAIELAGPAARVRPRAALVDAGGPPDTVGAVVAAAGGRAMAVDAWGTAVDGRGAHGAGGVEAAGSTDAADPVTATATAIAAAPVPVAAADATAADTDGAAAWPWPAPPDPTAPQAIVFTSGTSGAPKGAVLTWGNQHASWAASRARLGHGPDDVWLVALPLHHVGGLAIVLRAAFDGAAVVVLPRFDAAAVADAIVGVGVSRVSLVPSTLRPVLDALTARGVAEAPPSLRTVLLGGGPLAGAPVAEAVARGLPLALTYGLTEAASQVATTRPGWTPALPAAAPPLDGVAVRVAPPGAPIESGTSGSAGDVVERGGASGDGDGDADDARAPVGEILVRGATVFAGYWDDPAATARALAGGWLHTGDLGRLDAAGRLTVVGRADDRITTGGESVDPTEVEAALDGHPGIGASCVVGVADARWGQVVAAVVEPPAGRRPDDVPDAAALRAWLAGRLASHKVPRRVVAVAALPRTPAGKVARAAARRLAELHLDAADPAGDDVVDERLDRAADKADDAVDERHRDDRPGAEQQAQRGAALVVGGGDAGAQQREQRDERPDDQPDGGQQGAVHLGGGQDVDASDRGHLR